MSIGEWIQAGVGFVLSLSLVAVVWYAWEARRTARATQSLVRYAELNHAAETQPVVLPRLGYQSRGKEQAFAVTLENFGRGPAVNLVMKVQILSEHLHGRRIYDWEVVDSDDRGRDITEPNLAPEPFDWPDGRPMAPREKLELFYQISAGVRQDVKQTNETIGVLELAYDDINGNRTRIAVDLLLDHRHVFLRFGRFSHLVNLVGDVTERSG